MKRLRFLAGVGVVGFVMVFCSNVFAATYEIDAVHSSVEFKIRHLVGRVTGAFKQFAGMIEFDEANPAAGSVKAKIDVDSIDTRNGDRDHHLRTADFFDTANFPKMTFVSKRVDPVAKKIIGDLTLHGVTKEVALDYSFNGTAADKKGLQHLGGSATCVINRNDFGINYDPTAVMLGNEVTVTLEIEAIAKASEE